MPLSPITAPDAAPPEPPRAVRAPVDLYLLLAVVGLSVASLLTLSGATRNLVPRQPNYYVDRQAVYLVAGAVMMLVLARIDYSRLRFLKNLIYAALILGILGVLAIGHTARGSQRAINLSFFSFQASELGKVLLIVALSAFVVSRARRIAHRETTAQVMLAALIPAIFVILQPDLGSGMVYLVIAFTMLFIAGSSWRHLGALVAGGIAAMLCFQVFVNVGMTIGIMPITGITLPLMSYGGSSVITTLLAVGLLQSIYLQARAAEALKGRVPR
jgi:rod shape determining protein RodA